MPKTSRHLTIACSRCGRAAAEISLLPGAPGGEAMWSDKDRLERSEFMGTVIKFGEWESLTAFFETLARGDYKAVRAQDADFIAFHCHTCQRVYCERCWTIEAPVFDEGFYDYTSGFCPAGHEQVVDD